MPYAACRWKHPSITVEQREKLLQPMPVRLRRHYLLCPPIRLTQGLPEKYHISRCTAATPIDPGRLELSSHDEASLTREYALHPQVLHHKKGHRRVSALWQSNCLFCVQTQPQRSSRSSLRCSGSGEIVDACHGFDASHVVASVSSFSPFGKPQSLPDLVKPPAFRTLQQSQVRAPFPHEERGCLPVPTHPLQNAVLRSHGPITHFSTIRIATPNSLKLREGLWSSLSHAPQLSQTLKGRILQGIDTVTFDKIVSAQFHDIGFCASCPTDPRPPLFAVNSPVWVKSHLQRSDTWLLAQPNTQSSCLSFEAAKVPNECVWRW